MLGFHVGHALPLRHGTTQLGVNCVGVGCSSSARHVQVHGPVNRSSCNSSGSSSSLGNSLCNPAQCRQATLVAKASTKEHSNDSEAPQSLATAVDLAIGRMIKEANSLPELHDVVDEWRDSLNFVNTSAAFVKAARLSQGRTHPEFTPCLDTLANVWSTLQHDAGAWQLSNVLWACGKLQYSRSTLWSSTLQLLLQPAVLKSCRSADMANALHGMANIAIVNKGDVPGLGQEDVRAAVHQLVGKAYLIATHPALEGVTGQAISNVLWSCAKLRVYPGDAELNRLLEAITRMSPTTPQVSGRQDLANVLYAVSEFQRQNPNWQSPLQQRVWQLLLSQESLQDLADRASNQHLANIMLAVARMASCTPPILNQEFAQQCTVQLLQGAVSQQVAKWNAQDAGNSMWSLATLGLGSQTQFLHRLAAAVDSWLPRRLSLVSLSQVAWACRKLKFCEPTLIAAVVRHSLGELRRIEAGRSTDLYNNSVNTTAYVADIVASADMQHLAGDVRAMVCLTYRVCKPIVMSKSPLISYLWSFHCWLLQRHLLDGKGLCGILTKDQLAVCEKAAKENQSHCVVY